MKKNKNAIILVTILIILLIIIFILLISIKNKSTFSKPNFDENISTKIPEGLDYEDSIINISKNYSIYIDGLPTLKNEEIIINFISLENNNVWIKIRILNENEEIIGESGLVKPGEYLKNIKLKNNIPKNGEITYMIIGYEIDSYLSAGTIKLNTRVGE